jgi:hypothetical protein
MGGVGLSVGLLFSRQDFLEHTMLVHPHPHFPLETHSVKPDRVDNKPGDFLGFTPQNPDLIAFFVGPRYNPESL